ncbi:PPOX class probable F420-dependent enzyme [Nocardia tenerifensis]|uniref:PPOX class probable F420-dependent enzyme n=2 Tax=Nocardia tenerifensis TaxID=228006 RepID=A0A318KK76_9NOCA|nr:PPOX class probable F420-dependent enzyme [Nocardia tenerifensis]
MLDGKNFAVVATVNEDGSPHTSVVWVDRDDDALVFSTTAGRRKGRNLARDPRVSVTVLDAQNAYRTIDIAGTAELVADPDKRLPARLSQKYVGELPPPEPAEVRRWIVRVVPERITAFGA